MLSNTCKYAIRAVIYLAVNCEPGSNIGIKRISKDLDIPTPFLGKILQLLAKHKILTSIKGPNGGFGLSKSTKGVSLIEVVDVIDGVDVFHKCVVGVKYCREQESPCALHSRYAELREEIRKIFETVTIKELSQDIKAGSQGYFI
jgi:Rrf2 family protein